MTDPATGKPTQRFTFCNDPVVPTFSGVLEGDFGCSTKFKTTVASKLFPALGATGILMFCVLAVMVPVSLLIGILAGMLWEILPNARGPLIVDACLRIGYTTILLGTLGYFGLGLAPESPDWGTAIKDASRLLRSFIHPALPPTIALMSFVLGLNLLADSLREQSMKD